VSKPRRTIPLLQRYTDAGTLRHQVAGVEASRKRSESGEPEPEGGAVTWNVAAHSLADTVPQSGDYLQDRDGRWWEVTEAGELSHGVYPCVCVPWGAAPEQVEGGEA